MGLRSIQKRTVRSASGREVVADEGRLQVPENRGRPGSRGIELAFVRLRGARADAPPLLYLEGGPGLPVVHQVDRAEALESWLPFLAGRDVVLLDQRGVGRSVPSLRVKWEGPVGTGFFASHEAALDHALAMGRQARADLVRGGVDPQGYTTPQAAADVAALREALDVSCFDLLGFSYGAQLALHVGRAFPAAVRRIAVAGVEGADHTWKLPAASEAHLERLAGLGAGVPDLRASLDRALDRLEGSPVVVEVEDRRCGELVRLPVGRFGLAWLLTRGLGDVREIVKLPNLLHGAAQGDPAELQRAVAARFGTLLAVHGALMLIDGSAAASPKRLERIRREAERSPLGNAMNFPFPEALEAWRPADVGDAYRRPFSGEHPVLFLSGSLDWNSPPDQAEEVRGGYPHSTHLCVEHAGHEQILAHPEVRRAVADFLDGRDVGGREIRYRPPEFPDVAG
jgi:pimeloyl-ACP methyl ester carboxylesterase